tara:strand:+ start:48827 stop:49042 length:216 start_codon:yes stop_codon:yes gene_type:complete
MKIKKIISQYRRDFTAEYECESCGNIETGRGYDDDNFHQNVIPEIKCSKCGKPSTKDYKARETKYSADTII